MQPRNVLIIDDNQHNLSGLRDSVRKLGHRVSSTNQWRQGLARPAPSALTWSSWT
ncbi:hypothetical protein HS125_15530 [bacterium]|nr:hypothetical protein [bacterium]